MIDESRGAVLLWWVLVAEAVLIASLAAEFNDRGFVHVPDLFTSADIAALTDAVEGAKMESRPWTGPWLKHGEHVTLDIHREIHRTSPVWADALSQPHVRELVSACLGGKSVEVVASMVVTKPPKTGQPFPLHQDSAYYASGTNDYVIMTVYLDPCTEHNGPIRFVPKSHTHGAIEHVRGGVKRHLPSYRFEDSVPVMAKPGDVTLFHIHTVHCSAPNLSDAPRRTVRVGYGVRR